MFYIDSTGKHGLVAAMEDLTEGATDPYNWGHNGYEWGCSNQIVEGANGTAIGTGKENTKSALEETNRSFIDQYEF